MYMLHKIEIKVLIRGKCINKMYMIFYVEKNAERLATQ